MIKLRIKITTTADSAAEPELCSLPKEEKASTAHALQSNQMASIFRGAKLVDTAAKILYFKKFWDTAVAQSVSTQCTVFKAVCGATLRL